MFFTSKSRFNQSTCSLYGEEEIYSTDDLKHLKHCNNSGVDINKYTFSPQT